MIITNKKNLDQSIVNALKSDYQYKDKQYSVTSLIQGVKSVILLRRHNDEIEMDASDGLNMLFGTFLHSIMEKNVDENSISEEYTKITMPNGYILSGKMDKFNFKTKTLSDYKTTNIYKILKKDYVDWYKQLIAYAYMLKVNGIEVEKIRLDYFIKDYKPSDYKKSVASEKYYPDSPIGYLEWDVDDEKLEEARKWLTTRFELIEMSEKLTDDEIASCDKSESWNDRKCQDYCPACKFCNYWKEKYGKEESK